MHLLHILFIPWHGQLSRFHSLHFLQFLQMILQKEQVDSFTREINLFFVILQINPLK